MKGPRQSFQLFLTSLWKRIVLSCLPYITLCICKLLYKDDIHVCVNVTNVDGIPL